MPEGHTVHRHAREHRARFRDRPVSLSSPQGRFAAGAAALDGHVLQRAEAYGKHLFLGFPGDRWLHVHLGLYGTWTFGAAPAPAPRGAVRVRLENAESYADLRGATVCELLTTPETSAIQARLGPDPLRPRPQTDPAWSRLSRSRTPLGQLLMDQSVVAGVGNVYRAELLFRAGISPFRPGRAVTREEFDTLWADLVAMMRAGLRAGRIVTTRPVHRRAGAVRPEDAHYVYRRAGLPCRQCASPVASEPMAGRNLFWCPSCQSA